MGPFARGQASREISDVNVVPLADVSLVLLIILLVLSPMLRQNMLHVRAAGRSAQPQSPIPDEILAAPKPAELVLVVGLNPDGLVLGGRRFSGPGEFIGYLTEELQRRPDKKVFLSPHEDVSVGLIVNTLETIKSCGAESVALVQT